MSSITDRARTGVVPPISRADVPPPVREVLAQAMSPLLTHRPPTAGAFAFALQQAEKFLGLPVTEATVPISDHTVVRPLVRSRRPA